MINPGLITLQSAKIDTRKAIYNERFQIEDNIGEAIHIHYRNMRFDFSIDEFLKLADAVEEGLGNILPDGVDLRFLSEDFLFEIRHHIPYIDSIELEEVELDQLECLSYCKDKNSPFVKVKLVNSPVTAYLENNNQLVYPQNPTPTISNEERVEELKKSVEELGYSCSQKYITLLGEDNCIRDGHLRAVILRHLKGNVSIPVVRVRFKDDYQDYKLEAQSKILWQLNQINEQFKRSVKKKKSDKKVEQMYNRFEDV